MNADGRRYAVCGRGEVRSAPRRRRSAVWTFSGLKARDMTAWGEAQRAKPQVYVRKQNLLSPERAGLRVGMSRCFVSAFKALRSLLPPVTWAFTRHARFSPGWNIAGFQPAWAAGKPPLQTAGIFVSLRETVGKCPNSRSAPTRRRFRNLRSSASICG